jgi:hypothetical protein
MRIAFIRLLATSCLIYLSMDLLRAQEDRIPGRIDSSRTVPLKMKVNRHPRPQDDQGMLDSSTFSDCRNDLQLQPVYNVIDSSRNGRRIC